MKKINMFLMVLFISLFCFVSTVEAANTVNNVKYVFCQDPNVLKAFRILGYFVFVAKILVPVILIIIGIKNLANAVLDSDDKASKSAVIDLIKKTLTAAFVFFIPSIVNAVFSLVNNYSKTEATFTNCGTCVTNVKSCNTLISRYK